jgi:hypothetical protein
MKEFKQIDLFDTSDLVVEKFATQSPINKEKIKGQNLTVFEHLSKGRTLTSMQAIKMWGITRLGARIWDLRHIAGVAIYDKTTKEAGSDVKIYSLKPFEDTK